MREQKAAPEQIYRTMLREVSAIHEGLLGPTDDPAIKNAQEQAKEILECNKENLEKDLEDLHRNAEWDVFTIALYGETNAGKSTTIEALRILLDEPGKQESRRLYRQEQERLNLSDEDLETTRVAIELGKARLVSAETDLADQERDQTKRENELNAQIEASRVLTEEARRNATFIQKFLRLFRPTPESIALKKADDALKLALAEHAHIRKGTENEKTEASRALAAAEEKHKHQLENVHLLSAHSDGVIIGTGRSDYTTEVHSYQFELGGQKLALLDVPGIEGREARVIECVWKAVQKAHAVIYVTAKAAPPQKGDGDTEGTLEKIAKHLGAQTEVWTLFNKRITNPIQLEKELVSDDEAISLKVLDRKMKTILGQNYKGTIPVSAQPAFLGMAECLVPGSTDAKSRKKFLAKYDAQTLLELSGIRELQDRLAQGVQGSKEKILQSNYNKARIALVSVTNIINEMLLSQFKPLEAETKKQMNAATRQLQSAFKSLVSSLDQQCTTKIAQFKESVESDMYSYVDRDVDNEQFERRFKSVLTEQQEALVRMLGDVLVEEVQRFGEKVEKVVDRYREHLEELHRLHDDLGGAGMSQTFHLNIDIDNGIKLAGLLGVLAGGVALFWNPAGWVLIAVGLAGLAMSAYKAVRSFFSSDYKKTQQKKSIHENLDRIADKLYDAMRKHLDDAHPQIEDAVGRIQDALAVPVRQIGIINETLSTSVKNLTILSRKLDYAAS